MKWVTPDEKAFFAKMDGDHNAVYVVESCYGTDRKLKRILTDKKTTVMKFEDITN